MLLRIPARPQIKSCQNQSMHLAIIHESLTMLERKLSLKMGGLVLGNSVPPGERGCVLLRLSVLISNFCAFLYATLL